MKNALDGLRREVSWNLKLDVWILRGPEKHSGKDLEVAYATRVGEPKSYFIRQVFARAPQERCLGTQWLWRVAGAVRRASDECALLVYELNERRARFFSSGARLKNPLWVRFEVPLAEEDLPPCGRAKLKDMRRKVRKYDYTASFSRQIPDFDDFYHKMYLPTISGRHGGSAVPRAYEPLKKLFADSGELTQIWREGVVVSAGLVQYRRKECVFLCHGLKDGSEEHLKAGAVDALHYFEMNRACEKTGGGSADMGLCRGFFQDGVFRHKIELGASVTTFDPTGGLLHLKFGGVTEALKSFLRHNPFVGLEKGRCRGVLFVDHAPGEADLDSVLDANNVRGLSEVDIYVFETAGSAMAVRTPAGRRVRLLEAVPLFGGI